MVYNDDYGQDFRPRHLPLPLNWEVEEPTDEVRALVREVLADNPRRASSPSRIASDLRHHRNLTVSVQQIAGALIEMGYSR